jgi:hypothetical protein
MNNFEYILCEFTYGATGTFYQEISYGSVVRNTDMDGNTIEIPIPSSAIVINSNPPRPIWAN